jgi:hypothetical protein
MYDLQGIVDSDVDCHLGCDTVWSIRWLPAFHPEDGGITFVQNIGNHLQDHMTSQLRSPWLTSLPLS